MRAILKDLILTAFAALTSLLTACFPVLLSRYLHFAIHSFSINFIPIGAIVFGAIAASGYRLGFLLFPHRVTWLLMCNAVILSSATYFATYYIDYSTLGVSQLMSFGRYITLAIAKSRTSLFVGTDSITISGPLNYPLVASQLAGYIAGAVMVVRGLYRVVCCDHCDRKLKNPTTTGVRSNSLFELEDVFHKMRPMLAAGQSNEVAQLVASAKPAPRDAVHELSFTLWKCDRCPVEFFELFIKPGGDHVGRVRDYCPSRKHAWKSADAQRSRAASA